MQELTEANLNKQIRSEKPFLLYIQSPFCGTCHLARQMVEVLEEVFPKTAVYDCNASLNPEFMREHQIESVPCLLVLKKSQELERIYAFHSVPHLYNKVRKCIENE